uniref:Xaa-Pro dipeptidyl-peptidase-like domain-containing protein n=1 Tax=Trypanosoma vivax (strain Y486) TaxID=1055687 RepID=G0TWJ6_TRYVY|nr:conserved hypothetical protein [Trypanosoma vivax Y486]
MRGMELVCSWYRPQESQRLPCVVYLHGNRGSRYDALEALFLLGHGFSLFSFDASGSGLSDGEYISLGFYERQDLAAVVEYLSAQKDVDGIALWGRSMGAVTSIMYAAKDDSIKCIVCDSPFSTLRLVIRDLVKRYAWRRIPSKFVDGIVDRLRERIARRAAFDIDDLDTLKYASECVVPAFIFHGREDDFVVPAHSISVSDCFKGLCLHELVKGGHNDERDETVRDTIVSFLKLFLVLKSKREQPTAEEIAALKRDEAGLQNSEGQSVAEREKLHLPSENTPPENKTQNICAGAECEGMGHRGPRSVFLDPISFKRPHLINVTSTHTSDEPKESPHTSLNTR